MDSEENCTKSGMKVDLRKNVSKRRKHISSSSDSSSSESHKHIKYKKSKSRVTSRPRKKIHSTKHKQGRRKNISSSSDSSSSVDSSTSSTDTSLSSSTSEEERKIRKKQKNKLKKLQKKKGIKKASIPPEIVGNIDNIPSTDIPLELMGETRSMAPMTKEEWEKKQSIVRRVYDECTGRNRLIKGDGEVIEEIVSRDRHIEINRQATKGDGDYFQKKVKQP